jgi:hypothetical protein
LQTVTLSLCYHLTTRLVAMLTRMDQLPVSIKSASIGGKNASPVFQGLWSGKKMFATQTGLPTLMQV